MLELYEAGVEAGGGVLVGTIVTPKVVGDPTMTIRLTNLDTGEVIEHEVEVRPDDGAVGFTVRQVAIDLRSDIKDADVSDVLTVLHHLDSAYQALNIPGVTIELADAALSNRLMTLDPPDIEDLDEETQALLRSLPEVDPEETMSVYDLQRDSNRALAASHILEAAEHVERGAESGAWSAEVADHENDLLAAAGRGLALLEILAVKETDDEDDRLDQARDALAAGDAHRLHGQHTDAVADYTRAVTLLD